MTLTLSPSTLSGIIPAPVSKSAAHRLLICAALSDAPTEIHCEGTNADIDATISCLTALGAKITRNGSRLNIIPISITEPTRFGTLDCGESGSTERFLLPVACALGSDATLIGHGRLPDRPLSPLYEVMAEHGAKLTENGKLPLFVGGKLTPGDYEIDGGVSSQFISGLLFALSLLGDPSEIQVTGKIESAHYIGMTVSALRTFGVDVRVEGNRYRIPAGSGYHSPGFCTVEGDWSSAAFLLAAGAVGKAPVTCSGLDPDSLQGDKEVFPILARFGAACRQDGDRFTVAPGNLRGIVVDGKHIPDLIPILSVVAAYAEGDTVFENIARLRIKESDRVRTVQELLSAMGIATDATENRLIVHGGRPVGGRMDSHNDHRIAMSAAIAASAAEGDSTLAGAEAVRKSYPRFFEDYAALGGKVTSVQ
ncbi:MAG: 3-phosphoshikimate 1-carboxyvinyltransferase [Eubacteriales bacterium]